MRPSPFPRALRSAVLWAGLALVGAPAGAPADDRSPAAHVVVAGAACDTLPYGLEDVLPVAIGRLEHDEWAIQRSQALATGGAPGQRLVTRWKALKHLLARAFFGDLRARCVVDLEPVAQGTVVTIQGGLTSADDLEANPGLPLAQVTYRRAAEKWLAGVHSELAARERQGLISRR